MIRTLYIGVMRLLGRHVAADDCWCKPKRVNVPAKPFLSSGPDEDVTGFSTWLGREHH